MMLRVDHVTKKFGGGGTFFSRRQLTAVDDVSFGISRGEFFSLVGESGCGKSSLARIVSGLSQPDSGKVAIDGAEIRSASAFNDPVLRRKVQMIFQDPYSSLNPRMRIRDILSEPLRSFRLGDPEAIARRVSELADIIRFSREMLDRYPHQFSGGQRQRIAIARALAASPQFLICDEPVSALDASVKGQIVNLLIDIQEQFQLTVLFISHDLSLVSKISDRVGVMYLGSLAEVGSARDIFDNPRHPYTRLLIDSIPSTNPATRNTGVLEVGEMPSPYRLPSGCRFSDRCPLVHDRCRSEAPKLEALRDEPSQLVACHLRNEAAERPKPPVRMAINGIEMFRARSVPTPTTNQEEKK